MEFDDNEVKVCPFDGNECAGSCAIYDSMNSCCIFYSILGELYNLNRRMKEKE